MLQSSPIEQYQQLCQTAGTKPNSLVVSRLTAAGRSPTDLDFRNALLGSKGVSFVLQVVSQILTLRSISLASNNLSSPVTTAIYDALREHPALESIDLSDNDIRLGGPALVQLVKRNRNIVNVGIENTFLRPLFQRLIDINCKKNASIKSGNPVGSPVIRGPSSKGDSGMGTFHFGDASKSPPATVREADPFVTTTQVTFTPDTQGSKKIARRATVCSEVYREEEIEKFEAQVEAKDHSVSSWLSLVLERHDLFSHLENFELEVAVAAMRCHDYRKGETMFERDDGDRDEFFVIANGEVVLTLADGETTILRRGSTTQHLMLMYPTTTTETATCTTPVTAYTLDRQSYKIILSRASKKKRAMYEGFLSTVGFLKAAQLSRTELLQLADSLKPATFNPGDKLIEYGEEGEAFFIIVEGVVEVFGRDDDKNVLKVCEFTVGDCVGELEFINHHRCVADVCAKTYVRTAKMNRHHFELVIGPVKDVLARNASTNNVYQYYRKQLERMTRP